ncbi:MAG: nucleotide-binding protein [Planctomycetota bacterium]|nr:MAG: nucleotide-binding protein [Planctomycetota bacterium]
MATTALCELTPGQEADFFALLASKDELRTKEGKPYFRVTFRDARREVNFPIWGDAPLAPACRDEWIVGAFYKLRAAYRETSYGPQLDIRRIRPVNDEDHAHGFDSSMCLPKSRREAAEMFDELRKLVVETIGDEALRTLLTAMLDDHREQLLKWPAATYNHHAYAGGFLEHVLSVAQTCVYFAEKYAEMCPEMEPPLDKDLVVAGGVLHDVGKLRELQLTASGAQFSPAGALIGHILQGRDMLREAAARHPIDAEKLLRLEHIIVAHQRLAEWGAPKPPMTPEALLVHYADDLDAKLQMMMAAIASDGGKSPLTDNRNPLKQRIYRGPLTIPESVGGDDDATTAAE